MAFDIAEFCLQNVKPAGALCFAVEAPAGGVELKNYKHSGIDRVASKSHMRTILHLAGKEILAGGGTDPTPARIIGPTPSCFWVPGGMASNELGEMSVNVYFAGLGSDRYVMLKNEWYMEIHGPKDAALTTHTYRHEEKRLTVYGDGTCFITAPVFNVSDVQFSFELGSDGRYGYLISGDHFILEAKFSADGKHVKVTKEFDGQNSSEPVEYPIGDPAIVANLTLPAEFTSVHITREACKTACKAVECEARNWAKHFDVALVFIELPA